MFLFLSGAAALAGASCLAPHTADYLVTFDATWSAQSHPQDFPPNPHFSGLIGGTHDSSFVAWEEGGLASPGIEEMAETGLKNLLTGEVNAAIADGRAEFLLSGGGIGLSPGSVSLTFSLSQDFPLVTLVSMIAPSPDWFAGVSGLALYDGANWADEVVVDLYPWDAGTDSGVSYQSPNQDTNPQEPISAITGYPFLNGAVVLPLGTFTFTRVPRSSCLDLCVQGVVAGGDATFTILGAQPGGQAAVLWGDTDGSFTTNAGSWCVDFGFDVPSAPQDRAVVIGVADGAGALSALRTIPPGAAGRAVRFQAAASGTCPSSCMSEVVATTVP